MPPKKTPKSQKVKQPVKASTTSRVGRMTTRANKKTINMGESFVIPPIPGHRDTSPTIQIPSNSEAIPRDNSSENLMLSMISELSESQRAIVARLDSMEARSRHSDRVSEPTTR